MATIKPKLLEGFDSLSEQFNLLSNNVGENNNKINSMGTSIESKEQIDYVFELERVSTYSRIQLKKTSNDNDKFEVIISNNKRHITYELYKNQDDYIVQSYVYEGRIDRALQVDVQYTLSNTVRTGTFTTTGIVYTTEVGASFEQFINITKDNSSISVTTNANNTGGLWEFTIDDKVESKRQISCYSDISSKKKSELYSNLKIGTYKVKGIFKGQDSANPVVTPRGWMNSEGNPVFTIDIAVTDNIKENIMCVPSNKEFAFFIKPLGATKFQFVPFHGDITGIKKEQFRILDNGMDIDYINMKLNEYKEVSNIVLSQHIVGYHPDTNTQENIEIWTNTTFNKNGKMSIDGKMKVLKPLTINNSYVIMGVAKNDIFDLCKSGIGGSYPCIAQDGSRTMLEKENDVNKSYCFLSSTKRDLAIALRYNKIKDTLRVGQTGKDINKSYMAYLQHRDINVLKLYNRLWNSEDLNIGYELRWSGDYIFTNICNIYNLLS